MLSNNKGFTLVELIVTVALISLVVILVVPSALDIVTNSKQELYNIQIKDIVTASKIYYEDCQYGLKSPLCQNDSPVTITIKDLLGIKNNQTNDTLNKKKIINPITNEDITNCQITINKIKEESKYTYVVNGTDSNSHCPQNELGRIN